MANILIVDDEEQVRSMLRMMLEREGHTITEAENGGVALRALRSAKFDLMILDLIMPEVEGLETLMTLRQTLSDLKVIAISGGGNSVGMDFLPAAAKLGAARTLKKPFDRDDLLNVLRELLP
ncbi:MAG: response regulator [Candidatus Hydrogenedentes bacterium]|nr:response regulator [Candidatus Hydrogenedentota bacterium]